MKLYLKLGRKRTILNLHFIMRIKTSRLPALPEKAMQLTHSYDRKPHRTHQDTAPLHRKPAWCQCSSRHHKRSDSVSKRSSILFANKSQVTGVPYRQHFTVSRLSKTKCTWNILGERDAHNGADTNSLSWSKRLRERGASLTPWLNSEASCGFLVAGPFSRPALPTRWEQTSSSSGLPQPAPGLLPHVSLCVPLFIPSTLWAP